MYSVIGQMYCIHCIRLLVILVEVNMDVGINVFALERSRGSPVGLVAYFCTTTSNISPTAKYLEVDEFQGCKTHGNDNRIRNERRWNSSSNKCRHRQVWLPKFICHTDGSDVGEP